jgi:hypothetical protein
MANILLTRISQEFGEVGAFVRHVLDSVNSFLCANLRQSIVALHIATCRGFRNLGGACCLADVASLSIDRFNALDLDIADTFAAHRRLPNWRLT